ncbi:protein of unknown function [Paraburkholderia kururiensis]|uniref:hypothetical protein n=1 Tax=Paraburkholderia kururiensis TaxID=984307 RepID=UPI0039A6624D
MNGGDQKPMTEQTRPTGTPVQTVVDIPGSTRTDFPDGSHLVEGPEGDKYLVSEAGDITATVPEIRRIQIDDLSLVLRHEIVHVHETTSHTLHFAGAVSSRTCTIAMAGVCLFRRIAYCSARLPAV